MSALVDCFITILPSHFKIQNINHTTRTDFLSLTENMCSSLVSCLSYTSTDDSSAVLRTSRCRWPLARKSLKSCVPRNPRKNQSPVGKFFCLFVCFFHEVTNYPINNRSVLALEVPQKTQPPQKEGELYWILLQQEIAWAVQCHKQQEGIELEESPGWLQATMSFSVWMESSLPGLKLV